MQPISLIMTSADRRAGVRIVFLMVINALLDFFSLASFLPIIFLVVDPGFVQSNKYCRRLYEVFAFTTTPKFTIAITLTVLAFIVFKNVISGWIARAKANYCFTLGSDLSHRMLSRYIEISYLKFTHADFSQEVNRIANLPLAFANNIVMPLANLLSEGCLFLALLGCVAWYDIRVFGFLTIVLIPMGLIYFAKRRFLSQISLDLKRKYPLTLKYALQVVEGLIEIKSFAKESFFKRRFKEASRDLSTTFSIDHINQTSATRLTETAAAMIICALIIYSLSSFHGYQQTVLLLGIYAGAGFRMIPSINRILGALFQIKSHQYLFEELREIPEPPKLIDTHTAPLTFEGRFELRDISYQYPGGANILDRMSLTIIKGDKIALVGRSGAGKTSLLLIVLGFLKATEGQILVDGTVIHDENLHGLKQLFSYVPQNPYILDGTIAQNIAFGIPDEEIDLKKIRQLVSDLDLEGMVKQFPDELFTYVGEKGIKLSGGQRQRIAIARALYRNAEILLFDEVTNQLDVGTEEEVIATLEKVSRQSKTIIMVTHHDHLIDHFERLFTLENGKIQEKPQVITSPR